MNTRTSNSLAQVQVCAMFRAGDIRRNVLLNFGKVLYGGAMFVSLSGGNFNIVSRKSLEIQPCFITKKDKPSAVLITN